MKNNLLRLGMKVRITGHGSFPDMNGRVGTVVRVLSKGDGAWIKCDEPLHEARASFPVGDERRDHTKVYFDEIEVAR